MIDLVALFLHPKYRRITIHLTYFGAHLLSNTGTFMTLAMHAWPSSILRFARTSQGRGDGRRNLYQFTRDMRLPQAEIDWWRR